MITEREAARIEAQRMACAARTEARVEARRVACAAYAEAQRMACAARTETEAQGVYNEACDATWAAYMATVAAGIDASAVYEAYRVADAALAVYEGDVPMLHKRWSPTTAQWTSHE